MWNSQYTSDYLAHHGIPGMKWGVRRYQNEDGSLTPEGKKRIFQSRSVKEASERAKDNLDFSRKVAVNTISAYAAMGVRSLLKAATIKLGETNSRAALYTYLASVPLSALAAREVYKKSVDIAIYRKEQYEKEHKR